MSKVREILRLKFNVGLSLRDIAASCNCGKSTVEDVLKRAGNANITWPCDINDKELVTLIYPPVVTNNKTLEPDVNVRQEVASSCNISAELSAVLVVKTFPSETASEVILGWVA